MAGPAMPPMPGRRELEVLACLLASALAGAWAAALAGRPGARLSLPAAGRPSKGPARACAAGPRARAGVAAVALRFLPVDTVSLRYVLAGAGDDHEGVAVFAAGGGDAGAGALSGALDAPGGAGVLLPSEEGLASPGAAVRAGAVAGDARRRWEARRLASAAGAAPPLAVRLAGAEAFVRGLLGSASSAAGGDPAAFGAAARCYGGPAGDGPRGAPLCGEGCPCSSPAWLPVVLFLCPPPPRRPD